MHSPSFTVADRVRMRLRRDGTDPHTDPDAAQRAAEEEVRRHNDLALARGGALIDDEARSVREVLSVVHGYGVLQPLLDDRGIEEIWVNGDGRVHVARGGVGERTDLRLEGPAIRDLVERMLQATGRRVDIGQPFVDASLPAVIYPQRLQTHANRARRCRYLSLAIPPPCRQPTVGTP